MKLGMTDEAMIERSVTAKEKNLNVPILAINGERDSIMDPADAQVLVNQLKNGKTVYAKLVVVPRWSSMHDR